MTEWWVSQAKHFCTCCKVWTGGHKSQILKHTGGRAHIENEEKMLKTMRKKETAKNAEEKDILEQLAEIEIAAAKAMGMDCPPAGASAGSRQGASSTMDAEKRAILEATESAAKRHRMLGPQPPPGRPSLTPAQNTAWTKHTDPNSGVTYYYNIVMQESKWEKPKDFVDVDDSGDPSSSSDSDAWIVCTDPGSGNVYYFNQVTQVSSWEKPAQLAVDLSKPPPPPKKKPPAPPPKASAVAPLGAVSAPLVSGWQEVTSTESMWQRPEEIQQALLMRVEEEKAAAEVIVNPIAALKYSLEKRSQVEEDYEKREVAFCEKRSLLHVRSAGKPAFPMARRKASGIRKREKANSSESE